MEIRNRLGQWLEVQKVRRADESPDVAGGRDCELLLKQLIGSSFQFKDAHLLAGRRIPSKRQGRRREIDLIVCTPQLIHLIEIKNWSGGLTVRNGVWLQTRRGGDVVDHGNLIRENRLKRAAVVEYLRARSIALDELFLQEHIVPKVGQKTYRKPELVRMAGRLPIRLAWTRGWAWGLLKAVTGLGSLGSLYLGKSRMGVSPADTVKLHAAGEIKPTARRLVELKQIVLG